MRWCRRTSVILTAAALLLAAAGGPSLAGQPSPLAPSIAWRPEPRPARAMHPDRSIEMLSRDVGRMLMIGFEGLAPDDPGARHAAALIASGRIGGVILFSGNVSGPAQLRRLTAALAAAGGRTPPFIAVDQEGGSIQRLTRRKGFAPLPSARTMARKPACEAYVLYLRTAEELAGFDINVNFGPVVDLDVNPRSPAIGLLARSYGDDPEAVAAYAGTFADAHAAAGVLTAAKHFPGHGSAVLDSHTDVVDIGETWQEEELAPFAALIAEDVPMVMVGHLIHPRFSDGDRPASLSRRTVTDELREGLGFAGLVVTDDLGMDAVARRFSPEEAAVAAIRAGADILIFAHAETEAPGTVDRIAATVAGAVAAGRIPARLVAESGARIRAARAGLSIGRMAGSLAAGAPCAEPAADLTPLAGP